MGCVLRAECLADERSDRVTRVSTPERPDRMPGEEPLLLAVRSKLEQPLREAFPGYQIVVHELARP